MEKKRDGGGRGEERGRVRRGPRKIKEDHSGGREKRVVRLKIEFYCRRVNYGVQV